MTSSGEGVEENRKYVYLEKIKVNYSCPPCK
jgi:hypothetical protein